MRRNFPSKAEEKIYDGYVNHPYEVTDTQRFQPGQREGKGFSPFAHVIDCVFRDTLKNGPVADDKLDVLCQPNPAFKRPAYYAAVDLLSGAAERGTTEFIDQWISSGHRMLPGYIISRHSIRMSHAPSQTVACYYDGVIYYEWGALPGHRFPKTAIPMRGIEWMRRAEAIRLVRKFEKGSLAHRRDYFWKFENTVRMELPETTRLHRIYTKYGAVGLLRVFFGNRWDAVITTPDMKLAKGIPYCYVKGDNRAQYLLCSMEDAVHHKLLMKGDCAIHDLTSTIDLGDKK